MRLNVRAMRRGVLAIAALAAIALMSAPISSPAPAAEVVTTAGHSMTIEVNQGQVVKLDKAAASVFVANPDIADVVVKSPKLLYVFGKKSGSTVLYAVDSEDQVLLNTRVVVLRDLDRMRSELTRLIPGGQIRVDSVDGGVVLSGLVSSPQDSDSARQIASRFLSQNESLTNLLGVTRPTQVNLRVRVAEVERNVLRQFGINWESAVKFGDFTLGLATGNPVLIANNFLTRQNGTNNYFFSAQNSHVDINGLIDVLSTNGFVQLLAEPNLTALSGETASFLAGGEFPVPVPQEQNVTTIEFKKFGVSLAFTPTVLNEHRISMRVAPEVSQLSDEGAVVINGFRVPALKVRKAETTVELASGQSFAIAGLMLNNTTYDNNKIPGLGDIPVIGELFKSQKFQRQESELVILVTPYIVNPVSAPALAMPTDAMVGQNGTQRLPPAPSQGNPVTPDKGLSGPVGYVVE